jgi:hypothetical protein
MKTKIILGLGSIMLLASSLVAGEVCYDRGYHAQKHHKKSHKYMHKGYEKNPYYLTRAEKRYIKHRRMEAKERRLERRIKKMERKQRIREARARAYEMDRALAIFNLATFPIRVHHDRVSHLAHGGWRH